MVDWGMTLAPADVRVTFKVSVVTVMLNTLHLAQDAENYSGLGDFVYQLSRSLTDQERADLALATINLDDDYAFDFQDADFPAFLNQINSMNDDEFLVKTYTWMSKKSAFTTYQDILHNKDNYTAFMSVVAAEKAEKGHFTSPELWERNYDLVQDPAKLKRFVVDFLGSMWEKYLHNEWYRTQNMLTESINAFSQINYDALSTPELVEFVTTRDMRGKEYFEERMNLGKHFVFVPSPHMGPYISWFHCERLNHDMIVFGARMPHNASQKSPALNRSELLVRLNALADETRLRMLEMLATEGEICAQDFITTLDLSQSSASRHLRQLTASGYITERRRDVAKCYTLNPQRIKDTMNALAQFAE